MPVQNSHGAKSRAKSAIGNPFLPFPFLRKASGNDFGNDFSIGHQIAKVWGIKPLLAINAIALADEALIDNENHGNRT